MDQPPNTSSRRLTNPVWRAEIREAEGQLALYAHDLRIQRVAEQVMLKKLVLVYSGWELVYRAEVE